MTWMMSGYPHFRKPAYIGIVTMNWESVAEFQWTIEGVKTGDSRCGPDQYAHGCRRYIHSKIPYHWEVDPPKKGFHQQKKYVQSPWGVYTYQLLSLAPHLILKRSSGNAFLQSKHKSLVVDVEKWGLQMGIFWTNSLWDVPTRAPLSFCLGKKRVNWTLLDCR